VGVDRKKITEETSSGEAYINVTCHITFDSTEAMLCRRSGKCASPRHTKPGSLQNIAIELSTEVVMIRNMVSS